MMLPWLLLLWSTLWPLAAALLVTPPTQPPPPQQQQRVSSIANHKHRRRRTKHHVAFPSIRQTQGLIWVDLENVRGRSGFAWSHTQVLERTAQWTQHHNLTGHVVVVADHGSISRAYPHYYYSHNRNDDESVVPLAVVFSGNHQKADDVLAQHVGFSVTATTNSSLTLLSSSPESMVVTADTELKTRCQRSVASARKRKDTTGRSKRGIYFLDPTAFLEDLEATAAEELELVQGKESSSSEQPTTTLNESTPELSLQEQIQLGRLDEEIQLRAMILDTQVQLDVRGKRNKKKSQMTNKRRKKLMAKLDTLRSKLALATTANNGNSLLQQATALDNDHEQEQQQQEMILQRWQDIQQTRKEQTGDRVVLAEQLRRELEEMESDMPDDIQKDWESSPAIAFIQHFNSPNQQRPVSAKPEPKTSQNTDSLLLATAKRQPTTKELLCDPTFTNPLLGLSTIQIVAISDTHGFEGQLLTDSTEDGSVSEILPAGDILFHLGDFALEGSTSAERRAQEDFDLWLAKQPHPIKIVVRGNHDPHKCDFSNSGAWYVTESTSVKLAENLILGIVPYGATASSKRSKRGSLPKECNILATHVPPYKTLDRTFTGKAAGSNYLTRLVRGMQNKPQLWLCGHIHEGRGVAERQWGAGKTTVINAANANTGRASHLEHDAVVVQVENEDRLVMATSKNPVEIVSMGNMKITDMRDSRVTPRFCSDISTPDDETTCLLMAVDMGLKSGVSLFNSEGRLLRYEQFYFDKENFATRAKQLIGQWERDANEGALGHELGGDTHGRESHTGSGSKISRLTHIAVEGVNGELLHAWMEAAPTPQSVLRVSPEEWRAELLNKKERCNGAQDAKAAARLIARQVVEDYGEMGIHQGKFKTDVAEAVCLGLFVCRKLGWIQRHTAVRRYSNGNIVVPKKT